MNLEYAQRWAAARSDDIDALCDLYGEDGEFTSEQGKVDDHLSDTLTTREMLRAALGDQSSGEFGTFTFEATKWTGDERYGLIEWNVTIEGLSSFRGVENPEGRTLETHGSTFLQFRPDGKILLESTYWNDNPVYIALGVPLMFPHYWEEGFDPASLMPG